MIVSKIMLLSSILLFAVKVYADPFLNPDKISVDSRLSVDQEQYARKFFSNEAVYLSKILSDVDINFISQRIHQNPILDSVQEINQLPRCPSCEGIIKVLVPTKFESFQKILWYLLYLDKDIPRATDYLQKYCHLFPECKDLTKERQLVGTEKFNPNICRDPDCKNRYIRDRSILLKNMDINPLLELHSLIVESDDVNILGLLWNEGPHLSASQKKRLPKDLRKIINAIDLVQKGDLTKAENELPTNTKFTYQKLVTLIRIMEIFYTPATEEPRLNLIQAEEFVQQLPISLQKPFREKLKVYFRQYSDETVKPDSSTKILFNDIKNPFPENDRLRSSIYAKKLSESKYPIQYKYSSILDLLRVYFWNPDVLTIANSLYDQSQLTMPFKSPYTFSGTIRSIDTEGKSSFGNGFLVDDCHVLTAAHVVQSLSNQVTFSGKKGAIIGIGIQNYDADVTKIQKDWAVIKLTENQNLREKIILGPHKSFNLSTDELNNTSVDEDNNLFMDQKCRVLEVDLAGSLRSTCYGIKGTSGSPFFVKKGDAFYIFGIRSLVSWDQSLRHTLEYTNNEVYLSGNKNIFDDNPLQDIRKVIADNPCPK